MFSLSIKGADTRGKLLIPFPAAVFIAAIPEVSELHVRTWGARS